MDKHMKKYLIIIGNFGSGKTELALNIAFEKKSLLLTLIS